MQGLMQPWSMTLDKVIDHAARYHAETPVVSVASNGETRVFDYATVHRRARRISAALGKLNIGRGDRVGSLMWNDLDHFALYFGVMGIGAVLHTLNPRLGSDRVAWIARHGGDRIIVASPDMRELLEQAVPSIPELEMILMTGEYGGDDMIGTVPVVSFDSICDHLDTHPVWGGFDENAAACLCYTSGTTGDPKGVLYSHRSNMLHALTSNQPGGFAIGPEDVVLAIVPMFHVNGWTLPFIAPMVGAELVLPARDLDGASLYRLIHERQVTFAAGVPTVWQDFLTYLDKNDLKVPTLKRVVIGGSAPSAAMIKALDDCGIEAIQAWGMTETSPIGTLSKASHAKYPEQGDRIRRILRQGIPPFSVETAVFDEDGEFCENDDQTAGQLKIRGPACVERYFGAPGSCVDHGNWFETGDIAVMDQGKSVRLVDRAKDVIKSGGEWIPSIELENSAMSHPHVRRAAVIAVADERWGERPLLVVEPAVDTPCVSSIVKSMGETMPKWWLPRQAVIMEIPLGATGKINKMKIRKFILDKENKLRSESNIIEISI